MDLIEKVLYIIGTILLLLFVIRGIFSMSYRRRVNRNINFLKSSQGNSTNKEIFIKDLKDLPPNVQKWLIRSGVLGKIKSNYLYIEQKGEMRLDEDPDKWIFASSKQFIGLKVPSFVWQLKTAYIPFINAYGADSFVDGVASFEMRLFNLVKLARKENTVQLNQSSFTRYLLELPWYPEVALNKNMKWKEIDKYSASVKMSYRGNVAEVYLYFNEDYDLIKTSAMRYKDGLERGELVECISESKDFQVFEGVRIPSEIHISWMLAQGKFTWYKLRVDKLTYK